MNEFDIEWAECRRRAEADLEATLRLVAEECYSLLRQGRREGALILEIEYLRLRDLARALGFNVPESPECYFPV